MEIFIDYFVNFEFFYPIASPLLNQPSYFFSLIFPGLPFFLLYQPNLNARQRKIVEEDARKNTEAAMAMPPRPL